jgi:Cdc6-like AAA superfamily ATPase
VSASSNNNTLIDSMKSVIRRKVSSDREGNSKSTVNVSHINFHKLMILYDVISQSISASIFSELFQCHYSRAELFAFLFESTVFDDGALHIC